MPQPDGLTIQGQLLAPCPWKRTMLDELCGMNVAIPSRPATRTVVDTVGSRSQALSGRSHHIPGGGPARIDLRHLTTSVCRFVNRERDQLTPHSILRTDLVSIPPSSTVQVESATDWTLVSRGYFCSFGVHPATLRKYTLARCTPYRCGSGIGERPVRIAVHWRIARHPNLPDKRPVYGVQYGSRTENMACIWACTPC